MFHLEVNQLHKSYGETPVFEGIEFGIRKGELVTLLGPSGCGKSTLLRALAGLTPVDGGQVRVAGEDITWQAPQKRGIGMVFQSYALYPTMTVEKNMAFGPRISGVPKAEIAKRVERAASMLHLTELLQRKPANLSGGQRQRVAIGRALVREAAVFLFDEPLSNLDAKLRSELRRELKELHASLGATMVYVTHDQVEAMTLASRIAVMRGGKIQQIDAPAVVYGQPANMYVAGFLGSPSMNFLEGRLQTTGQGVHFVNDTVRLDVSAYAFAQSPLDGQAVVLGIRPEDLSAALQPGGHHLQARVRLVEPMGPNQVLWLQAGAQQLGLTSDSALAAPAGTEVYVTLAAQRISLFNPSTQDRL